MRRGGEATLRQEDHHHLGLPDPLHLVAHFVAQLPVGVPEGHTLAKENKSETRRMASVARTSMLGLAVVLLSFSTSARGQGCPEQYGVQTYPNEQYCDRFYKVRSKVTIIVLALV